MMNKYILLIFLGTFSLFAETKTEQLSSDISVKKSERDLIIIVPRLGMESYLYDLPVKFCPYADGEEKPKCRSIGRWRGSFSKNEIDSIFYDEVNTLVSKKYDQISFKNRKAKISTATKDFEFLVEKNLEFNFQKGSKDSFERSVTKYLNGITGTLEKSLNLASDSRYREMSEKDQISFIRTKGKSQGIPAEVAQKLLDSAFAFSLYYGKIKGSITIEEKAIDIPKLGKQKFYSTSINISDSFQLIISEYKNGKFTTYKTISKSSDGDMIGSAFSLAGLGSKSSTTVFKPTQADSKEMVRDTLISIMKETMVDLSTKIKRDRKFKIIAPILDVDGDILILEIGCQQDIRTDHPFKVERLVDGEIENLGFLKIRERGDNCLTIPKDKRENSVATAIKGSYEIYDLALEHPWTGVFLSIYGGIEQTHLKLNKKSIKEGENKFGGLSIKGDLGYIFDSSLLSEIWFDIGFGFGIIDDMNMTDYSDIKISGTASTLVDFALSKRLYVGSSGVYTDFGVGAGYRTYIYDYKDSDIIDTTLTLENIVVDPFAKLGFNFSPDVEIFGKVGYTIPFNTKQKLSSNNNGEYKSLFEDKDLSAKGGINFSVGFSFHTDFIGGIIKIFSNPASDNCRN